MTRFFSSRARAYSKKTVWAQTVEKWCRKQERCFHRFIYPFQNALNNNNVGIKVRGDPKKYCVTFYLLG